MYCNYCGLRLTYFLLCEQGDYMIHSFDLLCSKSQLEKRLLTIHGLKIMKNKIDNKCNLLNKYFL